MHPKYWKRPRIMSAFESEGSAGGGNDSLVDAFAAHFDGASADDESQAASPAADSPEDAAVRLAAEDAAATNPEPSEPSEPAEASAEPQKFTVKVDGKDVTLTADELAEHVKSGMREKDYRQKTMEASDVRKTADAEIIKTRQEREQYAVKLTELSAQANYELNALKGTLTQELLQSDPVAYLTTQRIVEERQAALGRAQQELQKINQQRQTESDEAKRQNAVHQQEQLLAKVPEWKDPAKAKAEVAQLNEYLVSQGMTPEKVASISDHLDVVFARKAMLYDALMARAAATQTKVAAAPTKVARTGSPSVAPTDGRTSAMRELQATGSRDAAAAIFAEMFG